MSKTVPHTIGRYEVVAPLATGGMGELVVARRSGAAGFARLVVLKRLRPELGATAGYRAMFFDEARLAARLTHPNVCEVYDLEEVGDEHYLAMPYLEGVAFGALFGGPEPGDARLVAGALVQVCDGLHHAHELRDDDGQALGVVHRDVSPGNVFVTSDGVVKLLDFGIAKARDAATVTDQGVVKGKLAYMAPEQLAGGAIDRRADVFCVGVLAWEALAGRSLFARGSASLTAAAVLDEPIARVDAVNAAVPAALADVIDRALARAPGRRPPTAAALREAIEAAMAEHGGVARAPELAALVTTRCGAELTAQRERVRGAGRAPVTAAMATAASPSSPSSIDEEPTTEHRRAAADEPPTADHRRGDRPTTVRAPSAARARRSVAAIAALVAVATIAVLALGGVTVWLGTREGRSAAREQDAGAHTIAVAPGLASGPDLAAPEHPAGPLIPVPQPQPVAVVRPSASPSPRRVEAAPAPRSPAPGWVSIDSRPWATLFVDGKQVGITPYIRKSLAAGSHEIRAVLEDGRSRTFTVVVPEGRGAPPVDLRW